RVRLCCILINQRPSCHIDAPPGQSNHEESGPRGPRALDIRDTGKDAGVTVIGSARSNWLVAAAAKRGFKNAGHYFTPREGWHYEFTGALYTGKPAVSQDVKNRQSWLNKSRGEKLVVDGIFGPATKAAIIRYQKFLGVAADGIWGPKTQAAHQKYYNKVNKPAPKPASTLLRRGSTGAKVKQVQQRLKTNYALYAGKLVVDGIFGPATEKAVREFQRRAGLAVDGIVGPATLKRLGM